MDLNRLKEILTLVHEHELAELEIEQDGVRLWVRTTAAAPVLPAPAAAPSAPPATAVLPPVAPGPASVVVPEAVDTEIELAIVKSPIVGTFYRSSEPGSAAFVDVGGTVKKGQVLCIIEAMKLMNEIDSEYDGEVVNIYVENGQPVQYGERLFAIKTK
jgi:acetyl-CoA carboxylase biotin carboxyl carrier protein